MTNSSFSTTPNDSSSQSFPYICWNLEIYWRTFNNEQWTLSLVKVYIPCSRPNIYVFHKKSMIREENSMILTAVRLTTRLTDKLLMDYSDSFSIQQNIVCGLELEFSAKHLVWWVFLRQQKYRLFCFSSIHSQNMHTGIEWCVPLYIETSNIFAMFPYRDQAFGIVTLLPGVVIIIVSNRSKYDFNKYQH